MKYLITILLLPGFMVNSFGQKTPPPPPLPPPPFEFGESKLSDIDIAKNPTLISYLTNDINNTSRENKRLLFENNIFSILPSSYRKLNNGQFYSDSGTTIEYYELPIFEPTDTLIARKKKNLLKKNFKWDTKQMYFQDLKSIIVDFYHPKLGVAWMGIIMQTKSHYRILEISYSILDSARKKEVAIFLENLYFSDEFAKNPLALLSVNIDTSFTHFYPEYFSSYGVLFCESFNLGMGMISLDPKFVVMEEDSVQYPNAKFFKDVLLFIESKEVESELKKTDRFNSNGFEVETRVYHSTFNGNNKKAYVTIAILRNKEKIVCFVGGAYTGFHHEKYEPLWNATIRSIKPK